ncbi:MAG: type II toxin-antitoxin system VapC family toxin [Candidatus Bathyarchaeota archaeon]|nr:type II toxin-antitoxin system VapC family toxin [Candidatus Bathyarchaeota archaeon]
MIVYIDTNILLARYSPREPYHDDAKRLLEAVEGGAVEGVTSILTLVEVVSSVSRAYNRSKKRGAMGRDEAAGAFLRRVATTRNLSFIPLGGEIAMSVDGVTIDMPALLAVALELGAKTGVKTLDNLHVASATVASRIFGQKIDYFVTLDGDILKHKNEIATNSGVVVVKPADVPT